VHDFDPIEVTRVLIAPAGGKSPQLGGRRFAELTPVSALPHPARVIWLIRSSFRR
jgi:hypothetical protein